MGDRESNSDIPSGLSEKDGKAFVRGINGDQIENNNNIEMKTEIDNAICRYMESDKYKEAYSSKDDEDKNKNNGNTSPTWVGNNFFEKYLNGFEISKEDFIKMIGVLREKELINFDFESIVFPEGENSKIKKIGSTTRFFIRDKMEQDGEKL